MTKLEFQERFLKEVNPLVLREMVEAATGGFL